MSHGDLIDPWCPGGVDINARITAVLGAVLLVLLAAEGVTIVFNGRMIQWN